MCHVYADFTGVAKDNSTVSLTFSEDEYANSVHGELGLGCLACHFKNLEYPHNNDGIKAVTCLECHPQNGSKPKVLTVDLPYESVREMAIQINESCRNCHENQFLNSEDGAHVDVLKSGNPEAPICMDCHGGHDVTSPNEPRAKISQTCAKCHEAVYSSYKFSVHGAALEGGNMDVPTCVDCHGVHSIQGPRNNTFRSDSIMLCAKCHASKELMSKYNISSDVFDTYIDDFHGRSVNMFRLQDQRTSSNTAVCYDCHGVHSMRGPEDPLSSVNPANLMRTCQKCHKDANERFPDTWLGHYAPNPKDMPILYGVGLLYKLIIPGSFLFFGAYIGLDARKRWAENREMTLKALEEETDDYDPVSDK
jgi:predicted CXXCH cytochrome family protein